MNCRPWSEMIRGFASGHFSVTRSRITSMSPSHRLSQVPLHDTTTVSIQNPAQVIGGPAHVDIGNIHMPMLMRLERLLEAGSLARGLGFPA